MIKENIKFQDSTVFEGMTSIRAIIKGNEKGCNDRKIETIYYDAGKTDKIKKEIGYLKAVSENKGFSVVAVDALKLNEMTLGTSHGGIVAVTSDRSFSQISKETEIVDYGFYAMIEGIEDPYNFGYSLRSLYACGCDGIVLSERNWMSAAGVVARSSAGASELFPVFKSTPEDAVDFFALRGYNIVCADVRTDKILGECDLKLPILLIVGGEKRGISRKLLEKANTLVKINYARDFNASLSAASATTMFAYEIMRQNKKQ